jgi:hypothetical protein
MHKEEMAMKRGFGVAACFLGALLVVAAVAAGAGSMEPIETEDGLFKLSVLGLHDNHGITEVTGKIVNNSGQDYEAANFTLIAYRADGGEAARKNVEIEDLVNGALKVFRVDVNANILMIDKFGILFNSEE